MDRKHNAALQKAILFQGTGDKERATLINCLAPQIRHYSRGEIILMEGDIVQHLGIILAGRAQAYIVNVDGDRTIMADLTAGRMFGEVLVSSRTQQSPVTIHATTDVTAAFIEYKKVYSMCATACAAHRAFLQNMLKVIGDKYFQLFDRINILSERSLRERIMAYLYLLSERGKLPCVTIPFTKTVLAEYLLANRSALSRELSRMERDGLIEMKGNKVKLL